jgi:hypothetical protein
MKRFFYVYILISKADSTIHYTAVTQTCVNVCENIIVAHVHIARSTDLGASRP